jgi:hypothetical protein
VLDLAQGLHRDPGRRGHLDGRPAGTGRPQGFAEPHAALAVFLGEWWSDHKEILAVIEIPG